MRPEYIAALVALSLALGALGCGGPPAAARTAVGISADAVSSLDHEFAARYTEHAEAALAASATAAEYAEAMRGHESARDALHAAVAAVLAAESALDAWDAGDDAGEGFFAAAGCVAVAFGHLRDAIVAVGIVPPKELDDAFALVVGFGTAVCHVGI